MCCDVLDILGDADDFEIAGMLGSTDTEPMAERIRIGKEPANERLVHDRHTRRVRRVALVARASAYHARAEGLEVMRPNAVPGRRLRLSSARPAEDADAVLPVIALHRAVS